MGGTSVVEGIFVLLLVEFVSIQVNSESGFIGKSFKLAALGFELAELIGVPGGGVSEGDGFGFCGGNFIKTGGECSIVVIDKVSDGGVWSEGRVGDSVGQNGREGGGVYGVELTECDGAFLFDKGNGNDNVQGDSQMVGDCEVSAGEVADGDARGADQIQCVSFSVGGEINVLGDVEIV